MAELNIGTHCAVESCKQIDFLPFKCSCCSLLFCKIHRTVDSHSCTKYVENKEIQAFEGTKSYPCACSGCEKRELTQIVCVHCHNNYCLSHRHAQDHGCPSIVKTTEKESKPHPQISNTVSTRQAGPSKGIGRKSKKTSNKVALMKVKQKATGDKGIPEVERLYFDVRYLADLAVKSKPLFISKKWSVGKIIDHIAAAAGLLNENNMSIDKKLRLFNGETGDILDPEACIETLLSDNLFSGCSVIMEYVECNVLNLENLDVYSLK